MGRWGRFVARRRWWFIGCWLVLLAGAVALYPQFEAHQTAVDYTVTGSESQRVQQLVDDEFPGLDGEQDVVVFKSARSLRHDPAARRDVERTVRALAARADVENVVPPFGPGGSDQVASDGTAAIALLSVTGDLHTNTAQIQDVLDGSADGAGVRAYLVGETPLSDAVLESEYTSAETAEMIGIPIAFGVLLLATGAVVTSLLPLGLGVVAVLVAFGSLGAIGNLTSLDAILSSVVPMIGLGVGIDYTLFVVSRFREELASVSRARPTRPQVEDAVAVAVGTSGKTVLFSGVVVMVSLLSLTIVQARTFQQLALGMSLTVACALLAGLTLLPAALGVLGHRVELGGLPWRRRVVVPPDSGGHGMLGGLARVLMRRPVAAAGGAMVVLLILAAPTLDLRLGLDFGLNDLKHGPAATGQRVLAQRFSAGATMPIELVYTTDSSTLSRHDLAVLHRFTERIRDDRLVDSVTSVTGAPPRGAASDSPLVSTDDRRTYLSVVPAIAPDDPRTSHLVERLRGPLSVKAERDGGHVLVGGQPAVLTDLSDESSAKFWPVVGLVLALSFAFLLLVFRSLLLPLKAIAMNLLATGASYGALVWVFQHGHLTSLFDFTPSGTIQAYLPLALFALLFGLSMDYEVFLVRRIQEVWLQSQENEHAVAVGLEHTALQITAAAAIMVAIFGAFIAGSILEMKQIGFAFAFAVLVDATIIRIILVPALMRLAGRYNWWLPRRLDRYLPRIGLD